MKYVTLTDVSSKPLDMRLQTNHHAHLFVVTHSYPICPLPPGRSVAGLLQVETSKIPEPMGIADLVLMAPRDEQSMLMADILANLAVFCLRKRKPLSQPIPAAQGISMRRLARIRNVLPRWYVTNWEPTPDQSANIPHRTTASTDLRSHPSWMRFAVGTTL